MSDFSQLTDNKRSKFNVVALATAASGNNGSHAAGNDNVVSAWIDLDLSNAAGAGDGYNFRIEESASGTGGWTAAAGTDYEGGQAPGLLSSGRNWRGINYGYRGKANFIRAVLAESGAVTGEGAVAYGFETVLSVPTPSPVV